MAERFAASLPGFVLALVLSPLLFGIINKTKALVAGRCGQPFLQPYHDIAKLLRKGAVYSRTTSLVFRAGPVVGLAAVLGALAIVPLAGAPALLSFGGDLVLLAYCLGLMRFFTVLAALDTGSPFEGMGASREVQFSALAEPALLLALAALLKQTVGAVADGDLWRRQHFRPHQRRSGDFSRGGGSGHCFPRGKCPHSRR